MDVVMSNCVINLAPDKDAVFREAFRVLRPGGRLVVSDIVLTRPATEEEMENMALLSGCISGSLPDSEYADTVRRAGFAEVTLEGSPPGGDGWDGEFWYSATISGREGGRRDNDHRHRSARRASTPLRGGDAVRQASTAQRGAARRRDGAAPDAHSLLLSALAT